MEWKERLGNVAILFMAGIVGMAVLSGTAIAADLDNSWPMYGHDARHSGQSQFLGPQSGNLKWIFNTSASGLEGSSPVIGKDDQIYIIRKESTGVSSTAIKLYSLYPNGTVKWNMSLGDNNLMRSTPALGTDGTIYVRLATYLYAINQNGSEKWNFTSSDGYFGELGDSPIVDSDGIIYFGLNSNRKFYSIYPNGTLNKIFETDLTEAECQSSCYMRLSAISNELIYVTMNLGQTANLYAFNKSGNIKWKFQLGGYSSKAFYEVVLNTNADTVYLNAGPGGWLYSLDANSGTQKWSYNTNGEHNTHISVSDDGIIYAVSRGELGSLSAINPNGTLKWKALEGNSTWVEFPYKPIVDSSGDIYVGKDNTFYNLDNQGNIKFIREITYTPNWWFSPAIDANGTLYVPNSESLYAFGVDIITPTPTPTPTSTPSLPSELVQLKSDEMTSVSVGSATNEKTVVFKGRVSDTDGHQVRLQVELRNSNEYNNEFNESKEGLKESALVPNGSEATITVTDLINGNYHWRARAIDENGIKGPWQDFGGNLVSEPDFVVQIFTFAQMSDVHFGAVGTNKKTIERFTDTLQAIKTHNPQFVLSTGDIAEYSDSKYFRGYMGVLESLKDLNIPVYNVPGNHDSRDEVPHEIGLTDYNTHINTNNPFSIVPLNDGLNGYYFDANGYRFIGFDSGRDYSVYERSLTPESDGLTAAQYNRLQEADLKSGPKIIFMHHPVIDAEDDIELLGHDPVSNVCSEYGGNNNAIAFNRCELIDYSIKNNVDLILSGHTHNDYRKYIRDVNTNHLTRFVQTRSATKDNAPYFHGYSIVSATDNGVIPVMHATDTILSNSDKEGYVFQGDIFKDVCYVKKNGKITGTDENNNAVREIPDTYYTGDLYRQWEELVYYSKDNGEPDEFRCSKDKMSSGAAMFQSSELTNSNISISHRTKNSTVEYVYENISLGAGENASLGINFSADNEDYSMEFDDNGDGIVDNIIAPTNIFLNHAPKVTVISPMGIQSGNISIIYNVKDNESANVSILAQYSSDNITWFDIIMDDNESNLVNITSSPEGVDHACVWLSGEDIQYGSVNVSFRIKAIEEDISSDYAITDMFSVLGVIRYINGTIIDSVSKNTIAGATVSINAGNSTTTNATGYYSFVVTDGEYNLTAKLDPVYYVNNTISVSTTGTAFVEQNIELLLKPTGDISGSVMN